MTKTSTLKPNVANPKLTTPNTVNSSASASTPVKPATNKAVVAKKVAASNKKSAQTKVSTATITAKTPAVVINATESAKPKSDKVKMERDSFTMPKDEYAQIASLKKRLEGMGKAVKKSELLRAGLKVLATANDASLQAALAAIPVIKTGRPHKKH